jgi:hypothetical protein
MVMMMMMMVRMREPPLLMKLQKNLLPAMVISRQMKVSLLKMMNKKIIEYRQRDESEDLG